MTRSIIDSIKVLDRATHELAKKKRFIPIKARSNDEIGSLTNSFNQMGKDITNAIDQLNHLNKTLEDKVKERTDELVKANEMKDKLFSVIAHDLKNPFSTILGYSSILSFDFNELCDEEIQKYSNFIRTSAQNAYRLLENLLEWARTENDLIEYNPEAIDLQEVIAEAIKLESSFIKQKNIKTKILSSTDSNALGDRNMVKTIIRNLMYNACKFSYQDGEIIFLIQDAEGMMNVLIIDSGVGMSSERVNSLFKKNLLQSSPGTNNEQGTGLGLIICHEFIKKNGGTIKVESVPEKGTRIIVSFQRWRD